MKTLYWRPHKVSRIELLFLAAFAASGLFAVEYFKLEVRQPAHADKIAAAQLTRRAFEVIKGEKARRNYKIDPELDPGATGVIGQLISSVTSNKGNLRSKQTSVNPNFSALVVDYLTELKVRRGDTIAVGASGSFPAINMAVYAAIETMGLKAVVINSASSSQFGANYPNLLWIDMERILNERGVFSTRSIAASLGAIGDRGGGMPSNGVQACRTAIERNQLQLIKPSSLADSVAQRMKLYWGATKRPFKAYINVGGGAASVGTHIGKKLYVPGINSKPPRGAGQVDSVMNRFTFAGVPVIHLTRIAFLAEKTGFPIAPAQMPPVGQGRIYTKAAYNKWLAAAIAALLFGMLVAVIRTDVGFRLMRMSRARTERKPPEQMV